MIYYTPTPTVYRELETPEVEAARCAEKADCSAELLKAIAIGFTHGDDIRVRDHIRQPVHPWRESPRQSRLARGRRLGDVRGRRGRTAPLLVLETRVFRILDSRKMTSARNCALELEGEGRPWVKE